MFDALEELKAAAIAWWEADSDDGEDAMARLHHAASAYGEAVHAGVCDLCKGTVPCRHPSCPRSFEEQVEGGGRRGD